MNGGVDWIGWLAVFVFTARLLTMRWVGVLFRKFRLRQKSRWIEKLERQGQFYTIANELRQRALKNKDYVERENDLALAAMYEHDPESAVEHLSNVYPMAGVRALFIGCNLILAYLNAGMADEALEVVDELRIVQPELHFEQTLALLMQGRRDEAQAVYQQYREDNSLERRVLHILLSFTPHDPTSLEPVEKLLMQNDMWKFKPAIGRLADQWKMDIFLSDVRRYDVLAEQATFLIQALEREPTLFMSESLRFMRSVLLAILPKLDSFEGVAGLYGVIFGLDRFSGTLPVEDSLRSNLVDFWNRLYTLFLRTTSVEHFNPVEESDLFKSLLPADAEAVFTESGRCSLYSIPNLNNVVLAQRIMRNGFHPLWIDILPGEMIGRWMPLLQLVQKAIVESPINASRLEELAFRMISGPSSVSFSILRDTLTRLPEPLRSQLENHITKIPAESSEQS